MGKNCAIPGCPNEKYNGKYLKGFGFPQDEELRKRWIEIIQLNCPGWIPTKFPRFCGLHFDKKDIMDGKNNKLQYRAVPIYFNNDCRQREMPKKEKISTLIRKMNQNQLLYSSDSECEYQIITKVHKKPRKKKVAVARLGCVICNMGKSDVFELQNHMETVHGIVVDIMTPQEVLEFGTKEYVDGTRNQLCSECGLLFQEAPLEAINHVQTHLDQQNHIVFEEMQVEEQAMEDAEYIVEEQEDIKPDFMLIPKEEYVEAEGEYHVEEPLFEENLRTTFKCKLCNSDFISKEDIKLHIQQVHSAPSAVVPNEQMADSSGDEPATYEPQCYLCDQMFTTLAKMRKHVRNIHGTEEAYFCSHCTGTFSSLDMYEDHECLEEVLQ